MFMNSLAHRPLKLYYYKFSTASRLVKMSSTVLFTSDEFRMGLVSLETSLRVPLGSVPDCPESILRAGKTGELLRNLLLAVGDVMIRNFVSTIMVNGNRIDLGTHLGTYLGLKAEVVPPKHFGAQQVAHASCVAAIRGRKQLDVATSWSLTNSKSTSTPSQISVVTAENVCRRLILKDETGILKLVVPIQRMNYCLRVGHLCRLATAPDQAPNSELLLAHEEFVASLELKEIYHQLFLPEIGATRLCSDLPVSVPPQVTSTILAYCKLGYTSEDLDIVFQRMLSLPPKFFPEHVFTKMCNKFVAEVDDQEDLE